MTHGPYARLYLALIDDAKFESIYENDHHFASWCRLLMIAESIWPASAHLPANVRRSSVVALSDAGLIDLGTGGRYRIHGLDAERKDRSEHGRKAAMGRYSEHAPSNAPSSDRALPVRVRVQEQAKNEDGRADLEAFLAVRFRAPTPNQRTFMDAYCRTFDVTGPDRAARLIFANPDDPIGAMKSDLEAWRGERRDAARAAEAPKPPVRRKASSLTGVNAELAAMFRDQEAKA